MGDQQKGSDQSVSPALYLLPASAQLTIGDLVLIGLLDHAVSDKLLVLHIADTINMIQP